MSFKKWTSLWEEFEPVTPLERFSAGVVMVLAAVGLAGLLALILILAVAFFRG